MKKIYLQLTPFFPTEESFRGPFIFDQVNAIQKNSNYDIQVIKVLPFNFRRREKSYQYQGVDVHIFGYIELPSFILPGLFHRINYYRFKRFLKYKMSIKIEDIEFIHSHVPYPAGFLGTSLGKEFHIKNFIQHHSYEVFMTDVGRLRGFFKKLNNKYIYERFLPVVNSADLNITVSQKILNRLKSIPGFKNTNTYVLYNGVDGNKFYKMDVERDDVKFTIGCIANFWEWKDQMTLIKAIEILVNTTGINKNFVVKFIGTGPTRDICESYIEKNNLTTYFQFLNEIDHSQLNNFYNSLDLFVLPSYKEAFGCVFAEALQVGVPIITVREQGIQEVLHDEEKRTSLIDKGNEKQLSNLISEYMHNSVTVDYNLGIDHFIKPFLQYIEKL